MIEQIREILRGGQSASYRLFRLKELLGLLEPLDREPKPSTFSQVPESDRRDGIDCPICGQFTRLRPVTTNM